MTSGLMPEFALLVTNLYAPPGTAIPMAQSVAPLGWTSSTITDTSMRYNSSSGGSTGGSVGWSGWNFGGTFSVNGFTLSTAQLPSHNHTGSGTTGNSNQSLNHTHGLPYSNGSIGNAGSGVPIESSVGDTSNATDLSAHNHSYSFTTSSVGSGSSITPTYTTPQVKFVDHIMAVKS